MDHSLQNNLTLPSSMFNINSKVHSTRSNAQSQFKKLTTYCNQFDNMHVNQCNTMDSITHLPDLNESCSSNTYNFMNNRKDISTYQERDNIIAQQRCKTRHISANASPLLYEPENKVLLPQTYSSIDGSSQQQVPQFKKTISYLKNPIDCAKILTKSIYDTNMKVVEKNTFDTIKSYQMKYNHANEMSRCKSKKKGRKKNPIKHLGFVLVKECVADAELIVTSCSIQTLNQEVKLILDRNMCIMNNIEQYCTQFNERRSKNSSLFEPRDYCSFSKQFRCNTLDTFIKKHTQIQPTRIQSSQQSSFPKRNHSHFQFEGGYNQFQLVINYLPNFNNFLNIYNFSKNTKIIQTLALFEQVIFQVDKTPKFHRIQINLGDMVENQKAMTEIRNDIQKQSSIETKQQHSLDFSFVRILMDRQRNHALDFRSLLRNGTRHRENQYSFNNLNNHNKEVEQKKQTTQQYAQDFPTKHISIQQSSLKSNIFIEELIKSNSSQIDMAKQKSKINELSTCEVNMKQTTNYIKCPTYKQQTIAHSKIIQSNIGNISSILSKYTQFPFPNSNTLNRNNNNNSNKNTQNKQQIIHLDKIQNNFQQEQFFTLEEVYPQLTTNSNHQKRSRLLKLSTDVQHIQNSIQPRCQTSQLYNTIQSIDDQDFKIKKQHPFLSKYDNWMKSLTLSGRQKQRILRPNRSVSRTLTESQY